MCSRASGKLGVKLRILFDCSKRATSFKKSVCILLAWEKLGVEWGDSVLRFGLRASHLLGKCFTG
jgi:hypothetical protein